MLNSTKIKEKVPINDFISLIRRYRPEQIECTPHTFFRLSQKQRELFTCDKLRGILLKDRPFLVGTQYNKNYAVFYRYEAKNLRVILNIGARKVNIVTFYYIEEWQIPKI